MSLLQSAPSLLGLGHNTSDDARSRSTEGRPPQREQKPLRSTNSIANLIDFVRNPSQRVAEVVENWYDATTKEERDRRQSLADRKQLLYLKMRMVCTSLITVVHV